jgi:hypothetical protein
MVCRKLRRIPSADRQCSHLLRLRSGIDAQKKNQKRLSGGLWMVPADARTCQDMLLAVSVHIFQSASAEFLGLREDLPSGMTM